MRNQTDWRLECAWPSPGRRSRDRRVSLEDRVYMVYTIFTYKSRAYAPDEAMPRADRFVMPAMHGR